MHWLYFLIGVSWLAFWIYWLVFAPNSGAMRGANVNRRYRGGFLLIVFVLFIAGSSLHLGQATFHQRYLKIIGLGLFYAGLVFALWARRHLGLNWGLPMSVRQKPHLITSGPYHWVRHPIYTGVMAAALGSAFALSRVWLLVFVLTGAYWVFSATQEEKLLAKQLPKEYPAYQRRTKMLIPYIL